MTIQANEDGTARTITVAIDATSGPAPRLLFLLANVAGALVLDAVKDPGGVVRLLGDVRTNIALQRVELVVHLPEGSTPEQIRASVNAALWALDIKANPVDQGQ